MNPTLVGTIVFACTFGGVLLGMWLRTILPEHHLSNESRDTVKLGAGLIATMTALVLGLVTASAKSSFDTMSTAVKTTAVDILTLDRFLARYGTETREIRGTLQDVIANRVDMIWPEGSSRPTVVDPLGAGATAEGIADRVRGLTPRDDSQRALQSHALDTRRVAVASQVDSICQRRIVSPSAIPCGPSVLAHAHVRELRVVCPAKRHGHRCALRLCPVGRWRRIPHSWRWTGRSTACSRSPQSRCATQLRISISRHVTVAYVQITCPTRCCIRQGPAEFQS